jgi:multidrug efflux pump subunit AcrA (membrane-fusion protein)
VRPGTPTTITLEENPGKAYPGTLARTSNALDPTARTMLSEVEMENPGGEVLPGAYVVVRLRVGLATRGMTIPATRSSSAPRASGSRWCATAVPNWLP